MAHVMKIKSGSVGALVGHYEREREGTLMRENIDQDRTRYNYNLKPSDVRQEVRRAIDEHERIASRAVRSDANVLFDWVITKPEDCPDESAREFFAACVEFLEGRYGEGNVLGGYVHMDEKTPHMHVPVIPVIEGKLQASKMVNRADLKSFHGDLGKHVDARLGCHVSVELAEDKHLERVLSKSARNMDEFQAAKDAAKEEIGNEIAEEQQRLECLQRSSRSVESEIAELRERISRTEAAPAREETFRASLKRAKGIEQGNEKLRERIEGLRSKIEDVRGRFGNAANRLAALLIDVEKGAKALLVSSPLYDQAVTVLQRNGISTFRRMQQFKPPPRTERKPMSVEETIRAAERSAAARNAEIRSRNQGKSRGRSNGLER